MAFDEDDWTPLGEILNPDIRMEDLGKVKVFQRDCDRPGAPRAKVA